MLTRLHFKNWRSLRDVTIDNLTPITVFVGANSSGKTNIVDAFDFLRYAENKGESEAVTAWGGRDKICFWRNEGEAVELRFTYLPVNGKRPPEKSLELIFGEPYTLIVGHRPHSPEKLRLFVLRWQLLRENFMPLSSLRADELKKFDLYTIDTQAHNISYMLNYMENEHPELYSALQRDLAWLLDHVDTLGTERTDRETRFLIREKPYPGKEAPSISSGTARILAMLTAYYALDMRNAEMPGLVVIEEPDTAVHPLLLKRLVELFRTYTEGEHPRQFILTTHNPMLLNYFEPEEVRIVERNERGETTVSGVPMDIAKIWLETDGAYNLGNLWTTRLLGGVPE